MTVIQRRSLHGKSEAVQGAEPRSESNARVQDFRTKDCSC